MCHVLLLATPPGAPPVEGLEANDWDAPADVRAHFPAGWGVRRLGVGGCACGLRYPPAWAEADSEPGELAASLADLHALAAAVAAQATAGPVHLYGRWNGEEAAPPVVTLRAPTAWFRRAREPVPEGWLVVVDPGAGMPPLDAGLAFDVGEEA